MAFVNRPGIQLVGVDRNFLSVALSKYSIYSELASGPRWFYNTSTGTANIVEALYESTSLSLPSGLSGPSSILNVLSTSSSFQLMTNDSALYADVVPIVVSEALRDNAIIDASKPLVLWLNFAFAGQSGSYSVVARSVAMMKKFPGFQSLTSLQTSNTPVLMSMDRYRNIVSLLQNTTGNNSTSTTPKQYLFIKLSTSVQSFQIEAIINQLNSLLGDDSYSVVNLRSQVSQAESAVSLISVVFLIGMCFILI